MASLRIGLALGGGAARGFAHIGVLKALLDAGIVPHVVAGTSIGAVVGGAHVAGRLEELEAFARSLTPRKVFGFFDFNLTGSGLINGQKLADALDDQLDGIVIEDLERPFAAIATEIGTGHEVWLSRGSLTEAIRASYAIPGIFRPVRINGRWLFDGALVNPIPVTTCRALGANYVIAVNLNADLFSLGTVLADIAAPAGRQRGVPDPRPAPAVARTGDWSALQLLQRQMFGRGRATPGAPQEVAPSISTVMIDAFNIVHERIARSRLAGDPPDALISPRLGQIGLFDFHRADELIERGVTATQRALDDVRHDLDHSRGHAQVMGGAQPAPF